MSDLSVRLHEVVSSNLVKTRAAEEAIRDAADALDAIAALVGPGDVVERVRALVQHDREHLADLADLAAVMRKP